MRTTRHRHALCGRGVHGCGESHVARPTVSGGPGRWGRIRAAASAKESIGMSTQEYGQDPDQQSGQLSPDEYGQQGNRFGTVGYQDLMDQMNSRGQGVNQDPDQQQQSGGQFAS